MQRKRVGAGAWGPGPLVFLRPVPRIEPGRAPVERFSGALENRGPKGEVMRNNAALAFDPSAFLTRIENGKTTREYRNKQVVFSQGDAADAVFYIERGKVKLTVVSTRGKEAVIGVLEQGSFFGEGCLAAQPLRMSTASAIQPSSIIRVGKNDERGWPDQAAPGRGPQSCRPFR